MGSVCTLDTPKNAYFLNKHAVYVRNENMNFNIQPIMRKFIETTLIEFYKTCRTDKYGQIHQSNLVPQVFGDKAEEVEQYCKDVKGILSFNTYGYTYGTYRGFSIEDSNLRKMCSEALNLNEHYIRNMTSW